MSLPVLRLPKRVHTRMPKALPLMEQYPLYALSFDGVASYVAVANSPSLNPSSAVTVEVWFKTSVVHDGAIVWKPYDAYNSTYGFAYFGKSYGAIIARVVDSGGTAHGTSFAWSADGRWHHLALTYDGSTQRLYLDGVLKASASWSGSIASSTYAVRVGDRETAHMYFNGLIALPRVYGRALSLAEIHRNIRNPLNPVRDGLVLFLPMVEGSGTSVRDFSGYGNNGTIYGAVWRDLAKYEVQPP